MQLLFLYILATVFQIIDMFIIKTKINNELRGLQIIQFYLVSFKR